jgi:alpha-aminoadipic semialdehyde synthase
LRGIGKFITEEGTPEPTGPFVIAVTGNGNVAKGALYVLDNLPIKYIGVDQLHNLATDPSRQKRRLSDGSIMILIPVVDPDRRYVYVLHVKHEDYLRDKTGKPFNRETYYSHPERFESTFADEVCPSAAVLAILTPSRLRRISASLSMAPVGGQASLA